MVKKDKKNGKNDKKVIKNGKNVILKKNVKKMK